MSTAIQTQGYDNSRLDRGIANLLSSIIASRLAKMESTNSVITTWLEIMTFYQELDREFLEKLMESKKRNSDSINNSEQANEGHTIGNNMDPAKIDTSIKKQVQFSTASIQT
jgi:hypothetical protein